MYLSCCGIPTVIVYFVGGRIVLDLVLWFALLFAFSILYSATTTAKHLPRLERAHESEEFPSLNLSK
jgi:hypothetical protein